MNKQLSAFLVTLSVLISPAQAYEEIYPPMPYARVETIHVVPGQYVVKGAPLMTLEFMKMFCHITASQSGTVDRINVQVGDITVREASLVTIKFLLTKIREASLD